MSPDVKKLSPHTLTLSCGGRPVTINNFGPRHVYGSRTFTTKSVTSTCCPPLNFSTPASPRRRRYGPGPDYSAGRQVCLRTLYGEIKRCQTKLFLKILICNRPKCDCPGPKQGQIKLVDIVNTHTLLTKHRPGCKPWCEPSYAVHCA